MSAKQQIEEMAELMCDACRSYTQACERIICGAVLEQAETLYNAGCRKQSDGEWLTRGLWNPKCSLCHKYNIEESNYCPNCGAKMKDGDADENWAD